jgi:hypothetical protein
MNRKQLISQLAPVKRRPIAGLITAGLAMTCAAAVAAAGTGTAVASGQKTSARAGAGRGQLVSVTPLRTLPGKAAVKAELASDGFAAASARYGIRTYRLVYRTIDAHGRPTTASGLLALPIGGSRVLTAVSYTHGTEMYRGDAPSMQPSGWEPAPAVAFASAGFAAVAPDYLGLGTGPGLQPWMDVPSEVAATLDMLRAARAYVTSHGEVLRRKVLATGFSQGASAALGLGRALQARADHWFQLGALASISGAYDFQGAEIPALLDGELVRLNPTNPRQGAKTSVIYTALTFVGINRVHHVYAKPAEVFAPAYAGTIEQLLDGRHTAIQVLTGTPATLYMAASDEQAVNANTWHCQAQFAASHRHVPVINLGTPDYQGSRHLGSNVAGTAQIVAWFLRLTR